MAKIGLIAKEFKASVVCSTIFDNKVANQLIFLTLIDRQFTISHSH